MLPETLWTRGLNVQRFSFNEEIVVISAIRKKPGWTWHQWRERRWEAETWWSMVGVKQWFGSRWLKVHIDEPNNDAEDNHNEQFNYNWWHPFLFGVRSWTSWSGLGVTQTERYKKRNIKESKLVKKEGETERKSCLWNENLIK